ncbi:hypothetical protein [Leptospira sanjuanensis]|uniref:hypothetical protein n=1 Tax=Leptospira sanjuanensis TaxID=2879643 RepID=UPI001EE78431|nr:hypothetical protein [Leptospira sanjuanensis]MCG6170083.1 hypothetical protein [Leptospira sanjuanensis]
MKKNKMLICLLYIIVSIVLFYCKSYELRPEARNVQIFMRVGDKVKSYDSFLKSLQENVQNPSSVYSKCTYLGDAPEAEYSPSQSPTTEDLLNDVKNQSFAKGANLVFCNNAYSCNAGKKFPGQMYYCENLNAVLTAQSADDKQAELNEKIAKEKEEKELYTKPHYWSICVATGNSNLPPSFVQGSLKQFPPKAFDTENQCADKAWYLSNVGSQFGIQCSCKYMKMDRKS